MDSNYDKSMKSEHSSLHHNISENNTISHLLYLTIPLPTRSKITTQYEPHMFHRRHLPGAILSPNGKFADLNVIFQKMLQERPSVKVIPQGIKENVLFMLGNKDNISRQAYRQRPCYAVDCGAWSGGSRKIHHYFISENNLDYVDKKGEQYFKYVKGKHVCLEPHTVNDIIVFKRYYCS